MKPERQLRAIEGDVSGNTPESDFEKRREELRLLENGRTCEFHEEPRWCIYGKENTQAPEKVLHWIRPLQDDEFVARKMAHLISHTGGTAQAYMTEWNEDLKGEPIYGERFSPVSFSLEKEKREKSKE